jgi:hypothetical protein
MSDAVVRQGPILIEESAMLKNGQGGVAVFGPAIAALEKEAADLEHRAAATRALVQQLRDHAGVAAAVKVPPRQNQTNQVSRKPDPPKAAPGRQQAAKGTDREQAKPGAGRERRRDEARSRSEAAGHRADPARGEADALAHRWLRGSLPQH